MPSEEPFVRNDDDKRDHEHYSMARAFENARAGIVYAFKTQRNVKIELCIGILAVALGFLLRIDVASWLAIVVCIGFVFALEIMNTAVESVVDLVSPEYHILAKRAKDCAAGAVYVGAACAVVVEAIVIGARLFALFAG